MATLGAGGQGLAWGPQQAQWVQRVQRVQWVRDVSALGSPHLESHQLTLHAIVNRSSDKYRIMSARTLT